MTDTSLPASLAPGRSSGTNEPSLVRDCLAKARKGVRLSAERVMPLPEETVATVIATERALDQGGLSAEQEERFWQAYARVCSSVVESAAIRQRYNIAFVVLLVLALGMQSIYITASSLVDAVKEQWAVVLNYENSQTPACASAAQDAKAAAPVQPAEAAPTGGLSSGCPTHAVTEPEYRIAQARLESYDHLLRSHTLLLPGLSSTYDGKGNREKGVEHFHHFVKLGELMNTRRFMELFILPALYGALGACAFVLRRFTAENTQASLQSDSGIRHGLRISIGVIAGLAIHWLIHAPEGAAGHASSGTIAMSLQHLSRIALSFVAGYGSEVVFNTLDRLVAALVTPQRAEAEPASHARAGKSKKAAAEDAAAPTTT